MILPPLYLKSKNLKIICCTCGFFNSHTTEPTYNSWTNNEVFSFIYSNKFKFWRKDSRSESLAERERIIEDILE